MIHCFFRHTRALNTYNYSLDILYFYEHLKTLRFYRPFISQVFTNINILDVEEADFFSLQKLSQNDCVKMPW